MSREQTRVWLVCPECRSESESIRDGVCPACHYTLSGGDRAADEALVPVWEARLAHG